MAISKRGSDSVPFITSLSESTTSLTYAASSERSNEWRSRLFVRWKPRTPTFLLRIVYSLLDSFLILMPAFSSPSRRLRHRRVPVRTGRMARIFSITPDQLRVYIQMMDTNDNTHDRDLDVPRILLLDCRSFVAYNSGHILDSVNVHCPAILRRRCGGHLPLRTVIPNSNIRSMLTNGSYFPVVLYDELGAIGVKCCMDDIAGKESMVAFVAKCLQTEADVKSVYYLEGGYQGFSRSYARLCTPSPAIPSPHVTSSSPAVLTCTVRLTPRIRDQEVPVQILSHLYLGSAQHASSKTTLQHLGITALLNVSQNCPNHFQDAFLYKCIPVQDTDSEDIRIWFQEAFDFIDQVKLMNGKVLIHCRAGISRSATICIAYLMSTKRLRMEEAYEYVKSRRRIVSPNFNFMGQLLSFEAQVFSTGAANSSSTTSPRSPLLAIDASTPDPDSLTPSHGARHPRVFDFTIPATPSVDDTVHLTLSPCVL